ncbi:MAG TPA: hypothetical protein VFB21_23255 [Chthonomonadaceae bacterium]|nr:hypothetical protein [Chthonomonadaceae bacterium]
MWILTGDAEFPNRQLVNLNFVESIRTVVSYNHVTVELTRPQTATHAAKQIAICETLPEARRIVEATYQALERGTAFLDLNALS